MDPRDFLLLARRLADANRPPELRAAIGRAYYAVYNVAFDLLGSLGVHIERGHAGHETVRGGLRNSRVDSVIHVAAMLRRLQILRVKADYWMRDPQPEHIETVLTWLDDVDEMIRDLDAVAADPATRERMTRAIQAWEQGGRR